MTHEKYMIAVWGAPGGGKTTLAVNMATVLADSGYMTCLVSGTDHGELQAFFGTSIPKGKGLYAAISNGRNVRESLTQARPNLCILELDTGGDSFDIASITPDQVQHMLSDLRDQFSYVVVDCTSHKESTFTGVGLAESDKVIVAIPHRVSAATWHIANTQMLEAVAGKTIYVDVNTREGGCDMDQLLSSMGLPDCDFKLNCVDAAYLCENTGRPIVTTSGRAEKKYRAAVLNLVKFILKKEKDERGKKNQDDDEPKEKRGFFGFGKPKKRESDGVKQEKKMSKRQMQKAEDETMRRAMNSDYGDDKEN